MPVGVYLPEIEKDTKMAVTAYLVHVVNAGFQR